MTTQELTDIEKQLFSIQFKMQSYMLGTEEFKKSQDNAILYLSRARDSINNMIKEKE